MIIKFLKENVYASIALTIIRIYVGWQWLHAGWGKLTADQAFDAKGFLMELLQNQLEITLLYKDGGQRSWITSQYLHRVYSLS